MDTSYISLLIFIAITLLYYLVCKPKLNATVFDDKSGTEYAGYSRRSNMFLVLYFFLVLLSQIIMNATIIVNTCGGSITQNIGSAFLLTLIPWFFIFGIVIIVLMIFPGFKSAFSNVIGYFAVAGTANNILTELLVNTDLNQAIDDSTQGNPAKNQGLKSAAEAIIKLCGNMSILINQIVPANFVEYWSMLVPLMKDKYQANAGQLKQQLLDTVVMRDNIGEALWYIYTAILLISITQYNIVKNGCTGDLASMQASYSNYLTQTAATEAQNAAAQSTVYTST